MIRPLALVYRLKKLFPRLFAGTIWGEKKISCIWKNWCAKLGHPRPTARIPLSAERIELLTFVKTIKGDKVVYADYHKSTHPNFLGRACGKVARIISRQAALERHNGVSEIAYIRIIKRLNIFSAR